MGSNRGADSLGNIHALQLIAVTVISVAVAVVPWLLSFFPLLGFLYGMLLRVLQFGLLLLWLCLLWQAHQGRGFRIPYVGD